MIGAIQKIAININKNGNPINTNDNTPAMAIKTPNTTWNNNACIAIRFTSSSELIRKNRIGTINGAKNALAWIITFDHLDSIYNQPHFVLLSYLRLTVVKVSQTKKNLRLPIPKIIKNYVRVNMALDHLDYRPLAGIKNTK